MSSFIPWHSHSVQRTLAWNAACCDPLDDRRTYSKAITSSSRIGLPVLTLLACFTASGHAAGSVDALLAQCTIDSYSETGRNFLKENTSKTDPDAPYRNWILLCMRAKGYGYSLKKCPATKDVPSQPSEGRCYDPL
jgi:hypothetical protein